MVSVCYHNASRNLNSRFQFEYVLSVMLCKSVCALHGSQRKALAPAQLGVFYLLMVFACTDVFTETPLYGITRLARPMITQQYRQTAHTAVAVRRPLRYSMIKNDYIRPPTSMVIPVYANLVYSPCIRFDSLAFEARCKPATDTRYTGRHSIPFEAHCRVLQ